MFTDPTVGAILLGAIQGLTEFLPVSSTGHVFLFETYMGLVPDENLALWLHIGSLLAVVVYFWEEILELIGGLYKTLVERKSNESGDYALKLLAATVLTLPTAVLVRAIYPYSELSLALVGTTLIITAGLIFIAEKRMFALTSASQNLSWKLVIILGLVQGFAVLPGISRSGLTIALLVWLGVNRQLSAKTSFLLSIPTIAGAALFTYLEQGELFYRLGFFEITAVISSAVFAYIAIVWMMRLIGGRWIYFVPYCATLGAVVLTISFVTGA